MSCSNGLYSGFSPEIAMFKTPGDGSPDSDRDWYIKGSLCVLTLISDLR